MRKAFLLLILCALAMSSVVEVGAVTDHGLTWGVEVDQVFNYTITGVSEGERDSTSISYVVTDLPDIPEDVVDRYDIPWVQVTVYDENHTVLPQLGLNLMNSWPSGLPIGDWDLINQIFEDAFASDGTLDVISTASEWGVNEETSIGFLGYRVTTMFSKADGMLSKLTWELWSSGTLSTRIVIQRSSGLPIQTLAIIGVGAVAIIAVAIVFMKRR